MDRSVYDSLKSVLRARAFSIVPKWLPGGKFNGNEYVVKNPVRNDKHAGSFKINCNTGEWADFADDSARGKNLIDLYAYINHLEFKDAVCQLSMSR